DLRTIDDPAVLEVLYDPTRFKIIRHLAQPRSIKELAAELHLPIGRLYYHVSLLEQHGLVEVAEIRPLTGRMEKVYRSAIGSFKVAPELQTHPIAHSNGAVVGALEDLTEEF